MEEKKITITKKDFDEAVSKTLKNQMNDPKLKDDWMGLMLMSLSGVAFAANLGRELFGESEE
jgi:hypothetical protein